MLGCFAYQYVYYSKLSFQNVQACFKPQLRNIYCLSMSQKTYILICVELVNQIDNFFNLGLFFFCLFFCFFFCFFAFLLYRAAGIAYGSSQARGGIGAAAAACATATATWDPSHVCDLHNSSWQCQILNLLSKAGDRTCVLMNTSWVQFLLSHSGNSLLGVF